MTLASLTCGGAGCCGSTRRCGRLIGIGSGGSGTTGNSGGGLTMLAWITSTFGSRLGAATGIASSTMARACTLKLPLNPLTCSQFIFRAFVCIAFALFMSGSPWWTQELSTHADGRRGLSNAERRWDSCGSGLKQKGQLA
jgi:hypothetical protein